MPLTKAEIIANIQKIQAEIPADVDLMLATKTRSIKEISAAIEAGITNFGENYVQEGESKIPSLRSQFPEKNLQFHLIGHLQTNKINKMLSFFDVLHSLDSLKLAKGVQKRAQREDIKLPVLLDINIAHEESKTGLSPAQALQLAKKIKEMPHLDLIGMMTLEPFFDDMEKTRPFFQKARQIYAKIQSEIGPSFEILSMGTSYSYQIAIEEGANLVRLGSVVFGQRC